MNTDKSQKLLREFRELTRIYQKNKQGKLGQDEQDGRDEAMPQRGADLENGKRRQSNSSTTKGHQSARIKAKDFYANFANGHEFFGEIHRAAETLRKSKIARLWRWCGWSQRDQALACLLALLSLSHCGTSLHP